MAPPEPESSDNVSEVSSLHGDDGGSRDHLKRPTQPYDYLNPPPSTEQHSSPNSSTPLTLDNGKEKVDSYSVLARPLELYSLGLLLMFLYAFAAIFSWTVTCILSYKPIGGFLETYYDQSGNFEKIEYLKSDRWRVAASIGSAVVSAVGIPLTSAICAGATPVYCQRKSSTRKPSLTMRQTLALADKGWSDIGVIRNLIRPSTSRKTRSGLLIFSIGLVGLAFVIPVLQSALVRSVHLQVASSDNGMQLLGPQIQPGEMSQLDALRIIPLVAAATVDTSLSDKQPFMWIEGVENTNVTNPADVARRNNNVMNEAELVYSPITSSNLGNLTNQIFFSDYPSGTDTGMLRALVLRFNSSVDCNVVPSSIFPSTCQGDNPLDRTYSNVDRTKSEPFGNLRDPKYEARLCSPGSISNSPWNTTGSRQDINEEFYLDFQATNLSDRIKNFTLHCTSGTSLGYFELPNYWNQHVPGPILSALPIQNAPNQTYYDTGYPGSFSGLDLDPVQPAPSPFMLAVLAIFGNGSFFDTTASHSNFQDPDGLLCKQLRQPFAKPLVSTQSLWGSALFNASSRNENPSTPICKGIPNQSSNNSLLLYALLDWLPNFGSSDSANAAFLLAMYSAQTALLDTNYSPGRDGFPFVYTSPGLTIQKPEISVPAIIVISVLLAIQLFGLTWLAILGSRRFTWTSSLNAFALLRIGAALHKDLPLISTMQAAELSILDEKPGWIGGDGRDGIQRLEIGGSEVIGGSEEIGAIGGRLARRKYRMVEKESDWVGDEKEISGWKKTFGGGYTDLQSRHHECKFRRVRGGTLSDEGEA